MADTATLAKWLVRIVREMENSAFRAETKAKADMAGRAASAGVWADANPDGGVGGMSGNPYRERDWDLKALKEAEQKYLDAKELADFTINRVIYRLVTGQE